MKLIFCPECHDVRSLAKALRICSCGESWGRYHNEIDARVGGKAVPLGFANGSFVRALANRPVDGLGERFEAFVIPHQCPTVRPMGNS